jgi:GAF domain-containing protein
MKQYRAEEVIGKHFGLLYQPEDAATGRDVHNLTAARIKGRHEDEWWRRRKDGSRFWANVVITALYDDLGHLVGFTKVIRDLTERKRREEDERFLVELQSVLSASSSYEDSLQQIAELVILAHADWSIVVLSRESDSSAYHQVQVVAHRDAAKRRLVQRYRERHPRGLALSDGPARVLRTGRAELMTEVNEATVDNLVTDPEAAELVETLGMRSYVCVPLSARGRILGSVTLVSADPGRRYGNEDLRFAPG